MKEIGDALGINESRVSQIHRAALEKVQQDLADLNEASQELQGLAKSLGEKMGSVAPGLTG